MHSSKLAHLQNVYDAKVQHDIFRLCTGVLSCWQSSGHHMHAQLHPGSPHAVTDLIGRSRTICHRPTGMGHIN